MEIHTRLLFGLDRCRGLPGRRGARHDRKTCSGEAYVSGIRKADVHKLLRALPWN